MATFCVCWSTAREAGVAMSGGTMNSSTSADRAAATSQNTIISGFVSGSEKFPRTGEIGVGNAGVDAAARTVQCEKDHRADQGQQGGGEPEQERMHVERRLVEDELTVALDHEVGDLLVGVAGEDHLVGLVAKVASQVGVAVGEVLVLAHQAAQLVDEIEIARLAGRVVELAALDGAERQRGQEQKQDKPAPHQDSCSRRAMRGTISSCNAASSIGPMCL